EPVTAPEMPGDPIATLRGIHHGYRTVAGDLAPVLVDLDLDLRAGERIALVGTNGAGKTTLMKLLTGLIVPRRGTVTVDGIDTRSRSAARLSDHVAYLYQHPQQMFLKDTVRADVALFPTGRKVPGAEQQVDEVITRVGLDELASRDGRTLSGGQQRRATIAIGLAMRPTLLLLDEPTSSLDVRPPHRRPLFRSPAASRAHPDRPGDAPHSAAARRTHLEPRRPLPPRRHRDARLPRRDRALRRGRHPRHGARCLLGQPRDRAG